MASSYEIDFVNLTRTCPGRSWPPFRTWRFHRKTGSCLQIQTNHENQAFSIVNKSELTFCDVLQAALQAHARICAAWRLLGGWLRSFRTRLRHLLSFQDPIYWNMKKKCTTWLSLRRRINNDNFKQDGTWKYSSSWFWCFASVILITFNSWK